MLLPGWKMACVDAGLHVGIGLFIPSLVHLYFVRHTMFVIPKTAKVLRGSGHRASLDRIADIRICLKVPIFINENAFKVTLHQPIEKMLLDREIWSRA